MSEPLVSAIIPTYRRPTELARAVRSVIAQDWRPLELVVIDDGSGDDTQQALSGLRTEAESKGVRCHFEEVPNAGPGPARNRGMELATGEFFAFLDDDDEWLPTKLSTQLSALLDAPDAGVSFTQYLHAGTDTPKPQPENMRGGWVFETLCDGRTRAHLQTLMLRRSVFEQIGGYTSRRAHEDYEYCLRAALFFPFVGVDQALTVIHTHASSISREEGLEGDLRRDAIGLEMLHEIRSKYGAHARYSEAALKLALARMYDEHVKHLLWLGRIDQAREAWQEAVQECGEQETLMKLKRKLFRARVASWFGTKLKKPE